MRPDRVLFETAAIALLCAIPVLAQEYSFRLYGSAEGLQNMVVLSLAQDHAGYIWAGTEAGLYRYNGTRFQLMGQAEGLPCSTEVHGLFAASDGALWANTCAGIFRFDGQGFRVIRGVEKLLRGAEVMAEGPSGGILISTGVGLYEASQGADGSFSAHPYPLPAALAGKPMHGILRDGPRLWFGCDRQLCMELGGQVSIFGREQGLPQDKWDGIQISQDGAVWVRSPNSLYRRAPGRTKFTQENPDIASSGFWGALTLGGDGSLMVPTDHGLAIYTKGRWTVVSRQQGLRNENTAAVLEDREGSVWLGLAGGGAARWLGRGVWESRRRDQGLPSDIVWSIRRDRKGFLWVGTSLGLARIDHSGRTRTWTKKDGLGGENVRWLGETSDGSIWAAMKPGGLARVDSRSGRIRRFGSGDGLPCDPEDLFVDSHDKLWLPTACGVFLNEQPTVSSQMVRVETPESFGPAARKVMEDKQGTIWVTNRTSLWSLRHGHWRQASRAEGLLTDNPYVMTMASDGSIWLRHRYDAGIDRLEVSEGRLLRAVAIVSADPKTATGTAFHGFDKFGNFWRGTTNGVAVLHDGNWTTFTIEDGLISNDCDGEAFWPDTDGSVWLGTSSGLAHFRSENAVPLRPIVANPTIVRLEVDQQNRLIRADFSTLNSKAEQLVQFAYMLDGGPWIDLMGRNISVTGLGPGSHRLQVRCRVRDGPNSPEITAADFRLQPRWTERWWARLLAIACVLVAFIQFVRWRLSAATKKQMELETIVAGRTANLREVNRSLDDKARRLRISEDRLKNAERLARVGHWDWDIRANQLSWSEEMFRVFDVPQDYKPTYGAFVQAANAQDRKRLERWVSECLTNKGRHSIEFQITRPNGDVRFVRCTSEVSVDEQGLPMRLFGACQDITDSRRAQQEDLARHKLESVGTLAGGIAHDFNNLLGGVLAQAELALAGSTSESYPKEELTAIRNVAIRGSEIVRQLLTYAGKDSEVLGFVDVSWIVGEMVELLKVSVSKRASLVTDLCRDLPAVRASAAQIRQIVMNLVTNASEAIAHDNGVIRVATACVIGGDATAAKCLTDGCYVHLEVSDTGSGMSQETLAKVFDPFYSSKGAGHGLGLAVVHGIVRTLGGSIHVSSEPGQGSMFRVLLPSAGTTVEATRDPIADRAEAACPSRQLLVLVVEDENPLRQAVGKMLQKAGFAVLEAADGDTAVDLLRANVGAIDLILLDMTIPGASSNEVLAEAVKARPGIRVILTSAYSQEMLTPAISGPQIDGFIRKPYRFADLVQILRKASPS